MKMLFAAVALATLIVAPAFAAPRYLPSYECPTSQYDSSGTPMAERCGAEQVLGSRQARCRR